MRFSLTLERSRDNTSLGIFGLILGLYLLKVAIRDRRPKLAIATGPLLSPYVLQFTWAAFLVYFFRRPKQFAILFVLFWIPVLIRVFL